MFSTVKNGDLIRKSKRQNNSKITQWRSYIMKSKTYKYGNYTFKSYYKKVGYGYEVGFTFGSKTIFGSLDGIKYRYVIRPI